MMIKGGGLCLFTVSLGVTCIAVFTNEYFRRNNLLKEKNKQALLKKNTFKPSYD